MTLSRKILMGFIACGIIMAGVAVFTFNNSEKFISSNRWVEHTHEVISEFEQILAYVVDCETGARGYVITGEKEFLEPYENAKINVYESINKAFELAADNPAQQKKIKELEKQVNLHVAYADNLVAIRKTDPEKARQIVISGEGKRITDGIRKIIAAAKKVEQDLLVARKESSEADAEAFKMVFAVMLGIILLILVSVYFIIITNLRALRRAEKESADKNWLLTGNSELNDQTNGEQEIKELAANVITQLSTYLGAKIGSVYIAENGELTLVGGFAYDYNTNNPPVIKLGQGLVGQVAADKKTKQLNDLPKDYIKVSSGLGHTLPTHLLIHPFQYAGKVKGVIEIAGMKPFSDQDIRFLEMVSENIGIAFNSSQSRTQLKELLEETQVQGEELQAQQEELRQVNEELEEQAQNLKQQQEELQMTNEELEEQTRSLELKNREVEMARFDIEQKTRQLEVTSKYKSEFLANMSHELRTPLNSLLILSKELADNKSGNLVKDQVECAEIIYSSGQDLLALINEVLDLSKIEAGKMDVKIESISVKGIGENLLREFKRQAEQKKLKLETKLEENLPEFLETDVQRLNQILKNLMSNALKFTEKGKVTIQISAHGTDSIVIAIQDTGIGIPEDKQLAVFEAFQQADGGTSRKYGGTGLGLSISRELARLLGAQIRLNSKVGVGSEFSLIVPLLYKEEKKGGETPLIHSKPPLKHNELEIIEGIRDDRDGLGKDDRILLIVEDDLKFAEITMRQANEKGFKVIAAPTGEEGLLLAEKYKPHAIILDLDLPGISGHKVLSELKSRPSLRHIPVHIVSVNERSMNPIKEGAIEYLVKPVTREDLEEAFNRIENFVSRKMKNLLIVEDDENSRKAMRRLIGNGDVKCFEAGTGKEALEMYKEHRFDCLVLDIGLPDMSGFELIYELEKLSSPLPPVIIYTGRELTREENNELQKYSDSIIIKGVKSEERLLDETALFLHRTISNLPESKQTIINRLYDKEAIFGGKRILLVDDDMRNIFALSKILRDRGMDVVKAENGVNALEVLAGENVDLVLMDIMMPEMDGYEAMRKIRAQHKFRNLPILALTAKAMKDDKQKCIDAGANDYITKPVDVERLLSLMRVWLSR